MDAISDDGHHALTLIAFIGSVFSPYYRRALQRDPATDPADHCALNVCLYTPGAGRWTMTERGARHIERSVDHFVIGPSRLHWAHSELRIDINERGMPLPHRVRGSVCVQAPSLTRYAAALDDAGRHRWRPLAPCARIEVDLQQPRLRWSGAAYLDSNEGDEPVTRGFRRWDWLRATGADGRTSVIYDTTPLTGRERVIAHQFGPEGDSAELRAADRMDLGATRLWRIQRQVRASPNTQGQPPRVLRTLEDTPFYARSLIELPNAGPQRLDIVHETLDATRLNSAIVQAMLPFRMPRRG